MNYRMIYGQLMQKAKSEQRVKNSTVYYERHHIIPTFMFKVSKRNKSGINSGHLEGYHDDKRNIVLLTPREHFLAHVLLYKFLRGTRYEYSAGAALVLFFNVAKSKHKRVTDGKFHSLSRRYERYRKEGLKCISSLRKGTFPCINKNTGESVGSLRADHPKVLSGEYVHHSKSKHSYVHVETGERIWCRTDDIRLSSGEYKSVSVSFKGMTNPNALVGLTQDIARKITKEVFDECRDDRTIISKEGHFHRRNFKIKIHEKLKELFPNRKSFVVVYNERLGEHEVDFLNREYNLSLIKCDLRTKFPKEK